MSDARVAALVDALWPVSDARSDARLDRDHGRAIPAAEARNRAMKWNSMSACKRAKYWDEYAAEVESWERYG